MDKKALIEQIRLKLEAERLVLIEAAKAAYEAATHEESKAENEYDTRGLEASYLAGAQAQRVADIESIITICRNLPLKSFTDGTSIEATAVVGVEYQERKSKIFLMPKGGGISIEFNGETIQVVTPTSPLGQALLGLKVGDTAMVEAGDNIKQYQILSIQ